MYTIAEHGLIVKRIISEIILNVTLLFIYVSSCCVYRILLSTSEIFSNISKNSLLLINDTQTLARILLVYDEIINIYNIAINKVCDTKSSLLSVSI